MIGIYKITNQLNGKVYIGQSNDIKRRWAEHRRKMNSKDTLLYQAMREFGIKNFSFEVVEECELTALNEKEKFYIQKYDALANGYNMSIIENVQHKINWEIAAAIIRDLKETSLSGEEISKKYNISHCLVSQINNGHMWHFQGEKYPIRQRQKQEKGIGQRIVQKYYCCDCGKEISSSYAKRCNCCEKKRREVDFQQRHPISREELKDLIRQKPFTEIGKMYKVSDNTIRKWCDKFNLPRKSREIKSYSDEEWNKI